MIQRQIRVHLKKMLRKFPMVSLTGPRQSGKTTLLREAFPAYKYYNLERLDHRELIGSDPIGFLRTAGDKLILDEVQNYPDLFSYIQVISDERNTTGQYILSGSQSFLLNQHISQSLAGRVSINHLFPLDISELDSIMKQTIGTTILKGFYPRIYDKQIAPQDFYPSYLQTYIQRDVRTLKGIENLSTFTRFLSLCAGRIGQVLNLSSLSNDAGISVNTAKSWLSLLEASFVIYRLQPYYKNFSKRLIKSPKLYFYDTGVVSSLLRLTDSQMVSTHYLYGALFENLVINEVMKYQYHLGKPASVYYWRESNGVEIDCIIELGNNDIVAIEIKGGQTFTKDYLKNLRHFAKGELGLKKLIVYAGEESSTINNVQLVPWKMLPLKIKELLY